MVDREFVSITQAQKVLNVCKNTLINWDNSGKFKPEKRDPSGKRWYSWRQLYDYTNEHTDKITNHTNEHTDKITNHRIGYFDPYSAHNMDYKIYLLQTAFEKYNCTDIIFENKDDRQGFEELLDTIVQKDVTTVYLLGMTHLANYEIQVLKNLCETNNVQLHLELSVVDTPKSSVIHINCCEENMIKERLKQIWRGEVEYEIELQEYPEEFWACRYEKDAEEYENYLRQVKGIEQLDSAYNQYIHEKYKTFFELYGEGIILYDNQGLPSAFVTDFKNPLNSKYEVINADWMLEEGWDVGKVTETNFIKM